MIVETEQEHERYKQREQYQSRHHCSKPLPSPLYHNTRLHLQSDLPESKSLPQFALFFPRRNLSFSSVSSLSLCVRAWWEYMSKKNWWTNKRIIFLFTVYIGKHFHYNYSILWASLDPVISCDLKCEWWLSGWNSKTVSKSVGRKFLCSNSTMFYSDFLERSEVQAT